jgi:capsule polysaccharide export protein KpsC/LpsZ
MPIIFKMHPQDPRDGDGAWLAKKGAMLVGGGINIHHLISRADRVVTWNSNAGIESLMYNKPVMMLGDAYWRNKDITFDADGINRNFYGFMDFEPDKGRIRKLLQFLVCRFLIHESNGEAIAKRIMDLKNGTPFYGV